jgi:hypothetical protein
MKNVNNHFSELIWREPVERKENSFMTSYEKLGRKARQRKFIESEIKTNATVKAVLEILNGNFKDVLSRLGKELPGAIDPGSIAGDRFFSVGLVIKEHLGEMGIQFNFTEEETSLIINTVVEALKANERAGGPDNWETHKKRSLEEGAI